MTIGDADEHGQIQSLSRYARCHFYAFLRVDFALLYMIQVNRSHLVANDEAGLPGSFSPEKKLALGSFQLRIPSLKSANRER